jgi:hypothetical protein
MFLRTFGGRRPQQLQTQLEEERRERQEMEARMIAEREVEREARLADQQRMVEMFQYM